MKVKLSFIVLLCIVVLGAILRIWAATDNFWVDEVATYYLALQLDSPMEALTRVRLDHHILNTAYMAATGDHHYWGIYRLLSVITGLAAVILIAREASHRGRRQSIIAAAIAALSYPMVLYSSEARGYAPAICFSLCALLMLQEGWKRRRLILRFLFWAFAILALLAHVTALYPIVGMTAWSAHRLVLTWRHRKERLGKEIIDCLVTYTPVYAALLGIYMIMRASGTMGGDIDPLPLVLMQTCSYLIGLPAAGLWFTISVCVVAFVISSGLITVARIDFGRFLFYLVTILIVPALTLAVNPREYVYPRYFLLAFPFIFLLIAEWLDRIYQQGRKGSASASLVLLIILLGNAHHTHGFLKTGRGGYFRALQTICSHSWGETVPISGDHDFRVGMMVNYYRRFFEPTKYAYYIPPRDLPEKGVEWYITHQIVPGVPQPQRLQLGNWIYQKIETYPFYGLSGMQWTLYMRDGAAQEPPAAN